METAKDKVERFKGKSEIFIKNNTKTFIIDIYDNYYFCNILVVGEDYLYIQHFTGKKKFEKERILWYDILKIEEYKEKEEGANYT